jgi:hypothetical protein
MRLGNGRTFQSARMVLGANLAYLQPDAHGKAIRA